jgi:hypothetical protein
MHKRDKTENPKMPSEFLMMKIMSVFSSPEEYLCMKTARHLFPPNHVPHDAYVKGQSELNQIF